VQAYCPHFLDFCILYFLAYFGKQYLSAMFFSKLHFKNKYFVLLINYVKITKINLTAKE